MPQPLLSIVVLVYNTAQYLHECFESLLTQQYANVEIIAIDDASSDGSLTICREYASRHPNLRVISKSNEGGAVSGNLGIAEASGSYIALVDSDDMVTPEGYRRLMDEALRTDADIVIGRALRLNEGVRSAVAFLYEPFVWAQRRVIESVQDFPDIIHDGFYWNKVFRTAFLREHGLGMVPGLLYADRPFVHKAYYLSRRTAIICDLVYLWRQRPAGSASSITQQLRTAANFADRMRSVAIEWNDFAGWPEAEPYRRAIALNNVQRALHPANGIVASPSFRQRYLPAMQQLLALYGDLDYRALGPRRALYLDMIRQGQAEALCFLLGIAWHNCWIAEIDGACYWQQPLLDNPEIPVARELLRIDFPSLGFFQLRTLWIQDEILSVELELHDWIMARCEVGFILQSLHGNHTVALEPLGRQAPHLWGFQVALDGHAWETGGLYGLLLHYRTAEHSGHYRISSQAMHPAVPLSLPAHSRYGNVAELTEAGGIAFRVH